MVNEGAVVQANSVSRRYILKVEQTPFQLAKKRLIEIIKLVTLTAVVIKTSLIATFFLIISFSVSCLFSSYLKWNGHSPNLLELSETTILSSK